MRERERVARFIRKSTSKGMHNAQNSRDIGTQTTEGGKRESPCSWISYTKPFFGHLREYKSLINYRLKQEQPAALRTQFPFLVYFPQFKTNHMYTPFSSVRVILCTISMPRECGRHSVLHQHSVQLSPSGCTLQLLHGHKPNLPDPLPRQPDPAEITEWHRH